MNSKERVAAAVNFKKPDRIPLWNVHHFPGFTSKWQKYMGFDESITPRQYYEYDTSICLGDESFFPTQKKIISEDNENIYRNDGWGRIVKESKKGYFSKVEERVLKEKKDIDKMQFEPYGLKMRYGRLFNYVEKECKEGYCIYSKIGGIYTRSHTIWPEDELLMDMALDEPFCNALFDKVEEHLMGMAIKTLKITDSYNTGLWIYDDIASTYNTMFSPSMFEKYLLPRYKKIISICKNEGCRHFYFHSDGNIGPFLDLLIEAGFEGFNPLEPRSGLGLEALRKKYGKRISFFGGVCNTEVLPRGNKKEIEEHVRPLIEMGKEGGVILGMASVADDISPEAYDYYMSLVKKYGQFT